MVTNNDVKDHHDETTLHHQTLSAYFKPIIYVYSFSLQNTLRYAEYDAIVRGASCLHLQGR
jgi:hypothetical protein